MAAMDEGLGAVKNDTVMEEKVERSSLPFACSETRSECMKLKVLIW